MCNQTFWRAQEAKEGFQAIQETELAKTEDKVVDPNRYANLPRFEVRKGLLYQVKQGSSRGEEVAQLLIPAQFRLPLLRLAYENPFKEHLGHHKIEG